jgi:hypothetical protein
MFICNCGCSMTRNPKSFPDCVFGVWVPKPYKRVPRQEYQGEGCHGCIGEIEEMCDSLDCSNNEGMFIFRWA